MHDFLSEFLGKPRARVLRAFMGNVAEELNLEGISKRAGIGKGATLREVKALEKLGILKKAGATKTRGKSDAMWAFNEGFQHNRILNAFIRETSPAQFDAVEKALKKTGRLSAIVLSGHFIGDPSRLTDLLVIGESLNEKKLAHAVTSLEPLMGREIRYATFSTPEFRYRLTVQDRLIRDVLDFPHRVLFDRTRSL